MNETDNGIALTLLPELERVRLQITIHPTIVKIELDEPQVDALIHALQRFRARLHELPHGAVN